MTSEPASQVDLRTAVAVMRRRIPLVALSTLVAGLAAFAFSVTQEEKYSATASLLFRNPGFDQALFGAQSFQPETDPTREAATNVDLTSLSTVSERTAQALGGRITPAEVRADMSISPRNNSDLVSVTATTPNPALSKRMADTYAKQYVKFRQRADRAKVKSAQRLVERDLATMTPEEQASEAGQALQNQLSSLQTLEALQTGNAELVQQADTPTSTSSPRTTRNAILGVLAGLLLGIGLALMGERLDRRIRDEDDLGDVFGWPVLGSVPESKALTLNSSKGNGDGLTFVDREAFHLIRTQLRYFNVDRDIRSVLITSALPEDGKSTVAWHLAATAAAGGGGQVVLVEADFHRPTFAKARGLRPTPGLAEVLTHQANLEAAIQKITVHDVSTTDSWGVSFDLITAGATPPNPEELIDSEEMAIVVAGLSDLYELVVIDTPPVSLIADAIPLMKLVSGVILVGQVGKTTRDTAVRLNEQLKHLDASVLGVVANRSKRRGYGGYGYYRPRGPKDSVTLPSARPNVSSGPQR